MRPASFLWLVRHDLRLAWRGFADVLGRLGEGRAPLVAMSAIGLVHLVAWPLAGLVGTLLDGAVAHGEHVALAAAGLASLAMWTTSQALVAATRALFVRSDLDLLLAAPVPPARILGARAVAIALSSAGSVALIVLPVANMGALLGRPLWLVAWPALTILGLAGTALGLMLAIAIFLAAGRQRARLVANLAATVIAGAFVLGVQAWLLLPDGVQESVRGVARGFSIATLERPSAPTRLVAEAAAGDVASLALLLAGAAGLFALAVWLLAGVFARAAMSAAGVAAATAQRETGRDALRFGAGTGASLRRKEWRLMLRDPALFSQLALQIIYTVPVAVVLAKSGHALPTGLAVAPAIVVIAAQLAASLAWLTVSGEDAPELIATAPVARSAVERAKLSAMAPPVALVLALPILGLALLSPRAGLITLVTAGLAAVSTALINLWHPMPGNRRGMLRRHAQSKLVGLVEHALALLWAVVVALAIYGTWLALVPALVAAGIVAGASPGLISARTAGQRLRALLAATRTAPRPAPPAA